MWHLGQEKDAVTLSDGSVYIGTLNTYAETTFERLEHHQSYSHAPTTEGSGMEDGR